MEGEEELKASLKAAFDKIDVDHDGKINKDELQTFVKSLGCKLPEKEYIDVINTCNPTGKEITVEQVLAKSPPLMIKLLIFVHMDKNGDKRIDYNEFKEMIETTIGKGTIDEKELKEQFETVDENHDGLISFAEALKFYQ
eukprot:TRINITY_DN1417_c0_g1_i4.p3 TRINITY_DN1417_c0_g1~~TRINITY_DN1417_c0_g1_i4.p3  ORF type:complete len:140 (-),score=32.28 TRINITY_DN1417_c0_g1_i4:63-482(-)